MWDEVGDGEGMGAVMGGEREKRRCRKVWRNSEMGEKRNKVVDEVGEGDV